MVQLGEDQGCKMILGIKRIPKSEQVCATAQYEQKNSSVILNNGFRDYKDLSKFIWILKINLRLKKLFLVAISGDRTAALTALSLPLE